MAAAAAAGKAAIRRRTAASALCAIQSGDGEEEEEEMEEEEERGDGALNIAILHNTRVSCILVPKGSRGMIQRSFSVRFSREIVRQDTREAKK